MKATKAAPRVKRAPNQAKALQRAIERDDDPVLFDEPEVPDEMIQDEQEQPAQEPVVKDIILPLDTSKPLCTRMHKVTLLNKTKEKLIFESETGSVIVTDLYGVHSGKQQVFNGTPDDFRRFAPVDLKSGDEVFIVRPLTRGRKVFFGRVVSIEKSRQVVCDVEDKEFFHNAGKRKYGDTPYLIMPYSMVYKSPKAVEEYAASIMADLEISKTQQRSIHQANARGQTRTR